MSGPPGSNSGTGYAASGDYISVLPGSTNGTRNAATGNDNG